MAIGIQPEGITKQIMLKTINTALNALAIFFISISICYAQNEIKMDNGQKANNCNIYNKLRESHKVREGVNNDLISSEYLDCSITPDLKQVKNSPEILQAMYHKLRVRKLPTSFSQSVSRKDTFFDAGFTITPDSIAYQKEDRNFSITLKGKITDNKYLIWVVDEILNGTYRSYYPAIAEISDNDNINITPYYQSGY